MEEAAGILLPLRVRLPLGALALAAGAALWLPALGLLYRRDARPYFALVILAPILIIAAGALALVQRLVKPRVVECEPK